jgi:hypothetical protein
MHYSIHGRSVLLAAGLLSACGGAPQATPVSTLAPGQDTIVTAYGEVSEGAWLGGKRWAVLAVQDETVAVVDFERGAARPVGGSTQRLIRNPANIFVAEDTLYVGDWGSRRITLWGAGRLVRAIPAPAVARGTLPRARDTAGYFYLDLYPPPGPDGSGNRDSAAVLRTNPALTRVDTLARLAPADVAEVIGDAGRRFERRVFSGLDRWGVLPDGSLWVARVYDNRVDWRSPDGTWVRGEPLPDRVLEVTRYDRELFLRRFPPELRRTAQELPFAAIKPPFEAGLTGVSGEVWLEKSRAPADSARSYHVVDRRGRLLRQVRLPGRGRVIALGQGTALVAEPGPEGTRFVMTELSKEILTSMRIVE